jgi:hypothetical protein
LREPAKSLATWETPEKESKVWQQCLLKKLGYIRNARNKKTFKSLATFEMTEIPHGS